MVILINASEQQTTQFHVLTEYGRKMLYEEVNIKRNSNIEMQT